MRTVASDLSSAREAAWVGLILLAVLVVFFGRALAPGKVLAPADYLFTTPYYESHAPEELERPYNTKLFDQAFQFLPWRYFAWKTMRSGSLPLWNPHSYCGTPFMATMQSAVLYPINLITLALPFGKGFVTSAILRLWIAGFGMYWLARRYGLIRAASMLAALSFMFSGYLVVWLGHPHTNAAVWLPALILAADRMIGAPAGTKQRRCSMAILAVLFAIQFTGGHIETSLDLVLTTFLYVVLRSWIAPHAGTTELKSGRPANMLRLGVLAAVALGLGMMLAAPPLMAFFEWLPLSAEFTDRGNAPWDWIRPGWTEHLLSLPLFVLPDVYGNPLWDETFSAPKSPGNYPERIMYVGIVTFVFSMFGIGRALTRSGPERPAHRWSIIWLVIGIVALGRAMYVPGFDWLNQLPIISLGRPERLRLIVSFSLCLLAAAEMDGLIRSSNSKGTHGLRDRIALAGMFLSFGPIASALGFTLAQGHAELIVPGAVALFAAGAVLFVTAASQRRRAALAGIIVNLALVDLIAFGARYNTVVDSRFVFPENPVAQHFETGSQPLRVTALNFSHMPDTQLAAGFSDVRGMDFPTAWYARYFDLLPDQIDWTVYSRVISSAESPLLRVLNLKYVMTAGTNVVDNSTGMTWLGPVQSVYLGELMQVQPRSFMVYNASIAKDDGEAAALLAADPERVYDRVVLSAQTQPPAIGPLQTPAPTAEVECLSYKANSSSWAVRTQSDGYLFTSDAYYPGWMATIDDQPSMIHRANLAFRAVWVPKGLHRVDYRYRPAFVGWGFGLMALGAGIVAWLIRSGTRRESGLTDPR